MITEKELIIAGNLLKTHGVKGELVFQPENLHLDFSEIPYLVCNIDGIFIPFFIEHIRPKSQTTYLILLQDIGSDLQARLLSGTKVYLTKKLIPESDYMETISSSWHNFTGYIIKDKNAGILGEITGIEDSTSNILFEVRKDDHIAYLIPANIDLILKINEEKKELFIQIPEGLLDI
ncbi:MAG: 16S rRNA processing protein RimM [Candidatus Azobacteroides sp.]|nr:16S rRNA processing protein RimM [Candidatus Azobacteroides sp.]